ncbi:MAG: ABC transporter permease [Acidimicrobiia bacterium]|nr:ABC transporter permease [Acidimicrobiia bacterium]
MIAASERSERGNSPPAGATTQRAPEPAESIYDASARFRPIESLRELWSYREVVWSFGLRRLRTRYKQAVFGVGWAVVQPLAFLALFLVFLDRAVGSSDDSYAAGSYAALVGWQFASTAMTAGGSALVTESGMLRKVFFPREAPVLGAIGAYLPDLAINTVLLLVLVPFLGGTISWVSFLLPIPYLALCLTAVAVGIPFAALAVYYRDFLYALPIGIQLLLFASPVAYPVTQLPAQWRHLYAFLNPMVGPLDALRRLFGEGVAPDWSLLVASGASTMLILVTGYRLLKALDRRMADVV